MQITSVATQLKTPSTVIDAVVSNKQVPNKTADHGGISNVTAHEWFAQGSRVPYDCKANRILPSGEKGHAPDIVQVFHRITEATETKNNATWTSFLPGWPDGSYGWSKVDQNLTGEDIGPRLFIEYVGHGDSDKPAEYPYSATERADLVEAFWFSKGITSTFIVGFDYSSIVALELLARQQERRETGAQQTTRIEGVLLINGGLYADGHSHPWFTTPILKSAMGGFVTSLAQRSKIVFGELVKPLWSKGFPVKPTEIDELYKAVSRRKGVVSMSKSAGFVDQHKQNAKRLDLSRLYHASRDLVSFHIVGSDNDPFEGRQAKLAQKRLGDQDLDVRILPGGHLATSEQPEQLAKIIVQVTLNSKIRHSRSIFGRSNKKERT
jgi:pimeloyl-ACP methyl ester carboxylesterase